MAMAWARLRKKAAHNSARNNNRHGRCNWPEASRVSAQMKREKLPQPLGQKPNYGCGAGVHFDEVWPQKVVNDKGLKICQMQGPDKDGQPKPKIASLPQPLYGSSERRV